MKATKPMWMVRAGQGGRHFDDFKERSFVAIGWSKIGSLQDLRGREGIAAAVGKQWPDWHPQKINMAAGQLYRFRDKLVEAVIEHYENLDQMTRQLVPLRRVYWPA